MPAVAQARKLSGAREGSCSECLPLGTGLTAGGMRWAWKTSELPTGTAGCQHGAERRAKLQPYLAAGEPKHTGVSSLSSWLLQYHPTFQNRLSSAGERPSCPLYLSKKWMPSQDSLMCPPLLPLKLLMK